MEEAAKKRQTGGSAYSGNLEIGDDFLDELKSIDSSSGIVKKEDGTLQVSNIEIHNIGLQFPGQITEEEYQIFGETLLQFNTAFQWIIGDFLAYGVDSNYGMAKDFAERLGVKSDTVNQWTWVCRQVEFSIRIENLSFNHHLLVAKFEPNQQQKLLQEASENRWSFRRLKEEIEGKSTTENTSPIYTRVMKMSDTLTDKKFKNMSPEEQDNMEKSLSDMLKKIRKWKQEQ